MKRVSPAKEKEEIELGGGRLMATTEERPGQHGGVSKRNHFWTNSGYVLKFDHI